MKDFVPFISDKILIFSMLNHPVVDAHSPGGLPSDRVGGRAPLQPSEERKCEK